MPALNHTHRYRRSKSNKEEFFCTLPDCFHSMSRERLVGKKCLCECGNEFILTNDLLRRAAPRCENCRNDVTARTKRAAETIVGLDLKHLFGEADEDELEEMRNG